MRSHAVRGGGDRVVRGVLEILPKSRDGAVERERLVATPDGDERNLQSSATFVSVLAGTGGRRGRCPNATREAPLHVLRQGGAASAWR